MPTPEVPDPEADRLAQLRALELLDTGPEERFDRVTRLAQRLFGVPVALVSLVDEDRQWFKSAQGLEVRETPREVSFCSRAIGSDDLLVVPDATADRRFRDNPLVTDDPSIRFYAGCPISGPDGARLGTLCIIDRAPRELTDEDAGSLRDLAAVVEQEIAAQVLATVDPLTGLSNRRGFDALAEKVLDICGRQGTTATVLYVDLDAFKEINDRFGHEEGDAAIRDFAQILADSCRASDVVGRVGGDEFVALLTGDRGRSEVSDRIDAALEHRNARAGQRYRLTASIGTARFDPEAPATLASLIRAADEDMFVQKHRRRTGG